MTSPTSAAVACPIENDEADGPLVVQPEIPRILVAVSLWIIGGLVSSVSIVICVMTFNPNDWSSIVCPGIFVLFGLFIDGWAFFFTLKCFNPVPTLVLSEQSIYPGSEFEVSWLFRGKTSSIEKLSLTLIGREKVTFREGTRTRNEESLFHSQVLVDTDAKEMIVKGFELVALPSDTMHSFKSPNNEIQWLIQVRGVVAMWPDIDDAFPITVLTPLPIAPANLV